MAKDFYRAMPPAVSQSEGYLCWAAALESWLRAVPGRPYLLRLDLLDEATQAGMVAANGSLLKRGLVWIAVKFRMDMKVFGKGKNLTIDFLLNRLKQRGYIYFIWSSLGSVGHAQVIWGVSATYGTLAYMDPWMGLGYNSRTLDEYYLSSNEFVVGYPR
jgi:hypothetical protein